MSPTSISGGYLNFQPASFEMPFDLLQNPDGLNLRDYQVRAIISAENAVVNGRKCVLLAMATGTGKTRTILGMIYLSFLKDGAV